VEYAAPLLILSPLPQPLFRRLALVLLTALHLAMALTLSLGSFPFVMIATYALLLRQEDWTLVRRLARRWSRPVTVRYDEDCGFCQRVAQLVTLADGAGFVRWTSGATESSIVVLERDGTKPRTRASAAAAIARALPLPFHPLRVLGWPGLRGVSDRVYSLVARNRHHLSALFGLRACRLPVAERPASAATRRGRRLFANVTVATVFGCVTLHSYNNNMTWPARQAAGERLPWLRLERIPEPRWVEAVVQVPQLDHDWKLFAPYPLKDDGWWVIDGVTLSGRRLDPLTGEAPTFDKPPDLIRRFDTAWRKYLYRLWLRDHAGYRPWFDRYITRRQHREDPADRLARFSFYYVEEWTREPGVARPWPTRRVLLSKHDCFARDP
jgi:predicted DCC family thiol-disulfide oxidoreductase YuxK